MNETLQSKLNNSQRIPELDFFRGGAIIYVIFTHIPFIANNLWDAGLKLPAFFQFVADEGGILFVILSGICAYLGSRSVKRGIIVLGCGMLLTAGTFGLYKAGIEQERVLIYWCVLHVIGFSMVIYPLFKRLPLPVLFGVSAIIIFAGYYIRDIRVGNPYLFILGFKSMRFTTLDYFPILPNLGWFMLGSGLGRCFYKDKKSLFPGFPADNPVVSFLRLCGRHSLLIYMVQYPLLYILLRQLYGV